MDSQNQTNQTSQPAQPQLPTGRVLNDLESSVVQNFFEHKKIKEFKNDDFQFLMDSLQQISYSYFGIVKPIDPIIETSIVRMIKRHYSFLATQDIIDAFENLAAGAYTVEDENSNIKHFGTFSLEFVGKVLYRYCKDRNKIILLYKKEEEELHKQSQKKIAAPPQKSAKEYLEMLDTYVKEKNTIPPYFNWTQVAIHLKMVKDTADIETAKRLVIAHFKDKYQGCLCMPEIMDNKWKGESRKGKIRNFMEK